MFGADVWRENFVIENLEKKTITSTVIVLKWTDGRVARYAATHKKLYQTSRRGPAPDRVRKRDLYDMKFDPDPKGPCRKIQMANAA